MGNKARALNNSGQHQEALDLINEVLARKPDEAKYWNQKSIVLFRLERYNEALAAAGKALDLEGNYLDAWINKGIVLAHLGHEQEATDAFNFVLQHDSSQPEALLNKAAILMRHQSDHHTLKSALELLDQALERGSKFPEAWLNRGTLLTKIGRLKEALDSFDQAQRLKLSRADMTFVLQSRCNVLGLLGKFEEALETAEELHALELDSIEGRAALATALFALGRYQEALEHLDYLINVARVEDPGFLVLKGLSLVGLGRLPEAVNALCAAWSLRDQLPVDRQVFLDQTLRELGRNPDACDEYSAHH